MSRRMDYFKRCLALLAIFLVFFGWNYLTSVALAADAPNPAVRTWSGWVRPAIIYLLIGSFLLWFLYAFTNVFPGKDWEKRTTTVDGVVKGVVWERRIWMVSFAYVFTAVVLSFPLWGLGLISMKSMDKIVKYPVSIIVGCAEPSKEDSTRDAKPDLKSIQKEVRCEVNSDQWVVNIGGTIKESERDTLASLAVKEKRTVKEMKPAAVEAGVQTGALGGNARQPGTVKHIAGGLVVPVYFIVLSLMGGGVGLLRRVPEIQRRSESDYIGTEKEPKLSPGEVREYLAFQIIQFISAPLIAIMAYHAIGTDSRATSVALGFTAGFASESILLMIRGVVEGIKPQATSKQPAMGSVAGAVIDKASQKPVAKAKVEVVGQAALKTESDDHGLFVIHGLLTGEQVIEATLPPGQAAPARNAKTKVTIEGGRTAACSIELP